MTQVHHPAPINQFYRLDYDEVHKTYVKTTRWNNVVNGHNFDAENCMAAAGAVALDAHTGGRKRTSPAGIRNYQDDFSGGIGVDDVQDAWWRHFGETLYVPSGQSFSEVVAAVKARRHAVIGVVYNVMPDAYQAQLPGNFDHALNIDDVQSDGDLLVYDSLRTKPIWMPQSAVRAAAESLALRARGTAGSLFVGYTAVRPLIKPVAYHALLPAGTFFVYDAKGYVSGTGGGTILDRTPETRGEGWVPCTPVPQRVSDWPDHVDRKIVRVTKGIYEGRYLSASYAQPI